jgi:hypothetical protein
MPLKLHCPPIPLPHERGWEQLSADPPAALIEARAPLIAQAAAHETPAARPEECLEHASGAPPASGGRP